MTGRTIPVTRTDGSEVASEATQALIHDQLDALIHDRLDLKNSEVVADLLGVGGKTLTDLHNDLTPLATAANQTTANSSLSSIDGGIGGASAAAAGDTGASTTNGFLRWMRDFWLSLRGIKTAANSLSMAQASDNVFIVGGAVADGLAPTSNAVRVCGVDGGGLKRTLLTDTSGNQYFKQLPRVSDTISLTTATSYKSLAVQDGYNSWWILLDGNFSGNVSFQYSPDNQSNWYTMSAVNRSTLTGVTSASSATSGNAWDGPIPQGATHIRIYVNTANSGTLTGTINISPSSTSATPGVTIAPTTSRYGFMAAPGVWYDDTSSTLTANSTFTSTSRDISATSSGSAFSSNSAYGKEYRVMAEQDVAFTLQIQASRDNSTFRVVQSITATNISGGGYVAEASVVPKWRYYRYAIVNGGTNAARTTGGSMLMAN